MDEFEDFGKTYSKEYRTQVVSYSSGGIGSQVTADGIIIGNGIRRSGFSLQDLRMLSRNTVFAVVGFRCLLNKSGIPDGIAA